jgi:protein-tyrosine phosphatase
MGGCAHWRTPVRIGDSAVLCSSLLARPGGGVDNDDGPESAFYLDARWRDVDIAWPHEVIDWPDFNVIAPDELRRIAAGVAATRTDGARVEIGCLGGHGRTGTLLATVIGIVEHLTPSEAIGAARDRYCQHAVETPHQAQLVAEALITDA